jgi:hypothetical protein
MNTPAMVLSAECRPHIVRPETSLTASFYGNGDELSYISGSAHSYTTCLG